MIIGSNHVAHGNRFRLSIYNSALHPAVGGTAGATKQRRCTGRAQFFTLDVLCRGVPLRSIGGVPLRSIGFNGSAKSRHQGSALDRLDDGWPLVADKSFAVTVSGNSFSRRNLGCKYTNRISSLWLAKRERFYRSLIFRSWKNSCIGLSSHAPYLWTPHF